MQKILSLCIVFVFSLSVMCFKAEGVDANGPFLTLNNPHNSGMFAVFTSVLGALDIFETEPYSGIKVELDGLYLDPRRGSNWWQYYYEPIHLGDEEHSDSHHVLSFQETGTAIDRGFKLGRERAHELIQKYIHIKPEIQAAVDKFIQKKFKKYHVIGVHYRGTDKGSEYPLIPYDVTHKKVLETIKKFHFSIQNLKIYVATDQADFLTFMLDKFPGKIIYNDFSRSDSGTPLHISDHLYENNYQKGREALLDCLILSKCHILVRSPNSSLSVTAGRFNITQPQVIVRVNDADKAYDTY